MLCSRNLALHLGNGHTYLYGDDGGSVTVDYWVWDGGGGYYYYSYQVTNYSFEPYIVHFSVQNPSRAQYWVTGISGAGVQGTDAAWMPAGWPSADLSIKWSATSYGAPYPKNIAPGEYTWSDPLFQFASKQPPATVTVAVQQGATDIKAVGMLVGPNVVSHVRSAGYWKHQLGGKGNRKEALYMPQHLDNVNGLSSVFNDLISNTALAALNSSNSSDMAYKAKRQLLALWLNVVSGKLDYTTSVAYPAELPSTATKVSEAIVEIEAVINDGTATTESLEIAKDKAEMLNCQ